MIQYTVPYYRSKVAKIQLTRSEMFIRLIFQNTVPYYKSKVAKIQLTRS